MTIIKSRPDLVSVSLGGGVQSTVMLMMGAQGQFGLSPDIAVFSDTGNEPPEVYDIIEWLQANCPVEVAVVRAKNPILNGVRTGTNAWGTPVVNSIPFHTRSEDGAVGIGRRYCTEQWKIKPIQKEIRRRLGRKRIDRDTNVHVEQWIGISIDEIERVSRSQLHWMENRFPLVEANISRTDCLTWWEANYPNAPPLAKSSCVICPYRKPSEWVELRRRHPDLVAEAAEVEKAHQKVQDAKRMPKPLKFYFHKKAKPLQEAIDQTEADEGGFDRADECTGYCWT